MTTKEQYSLGNDASGWVDIPLQTFKNMYTAGFKVKYGTVGVPTCAPDDYNQNFAPFRTRHSEYMRYLNSGGAHAAQRGADGSTQRSAPKSRPDLLPSKAVLAAGRVLAFGLSKHPDEKWKTLSTEDHVAAALRHIYESQNGPDEETGESHLAHALCRIAFAIARSQGD